MKLQMLSNWKADFGSAMPQKESQLTALDQAFRQTAEPGQRLDRSSKVSAIIGSSIDVAQITCSLVPLSHPVRIVAFDKTEQANWGVPWHQDRVIAVAERMDLPGFSNWSRKVGVWHCEPPTDLLRRMIFVRVHLDDTDEENGCMELALGTHRLGTVPANEAVARAEAAPREVCRARRGDLLVVKILEHI